MSVATRSGKKGRMPSIEVKNPTHTPLQTSNWSHNRALFRLSLSDMSLKGLCFWWHEQRCKNTAPSCEGMRSINKGARDSFWQRPEQMPKEWKQETRKALTKWASFATSMWSQFVHLTCIPARALHFFPYPSTQSFHLEKGAKRLRRGLGLWDVLTQANKSEGGKKREMQRATYKGKEGLVVKIAGSTVAPAVVWKELMHSSEFGSRQPVWGSHDRRATSLRRSGGTHWSQDLEREVFQTCCFNSELPKDLFPRLLHTVPSYFSAV